MKAAKLFVKNMNIDFSSNNFENPTIQKFYSGLQAFALNEKAPETVEDTLEPDYEGMKRMEKVVGKMQGAFGLDGPKEPVKKPAPKPRKRNVKEVKQAPEPADEPMEEEKEAPRGKPQRRASK